MTGTEPSTAVRASIVVHAPIEHAFRVYTEQLHTWWNRDHVLIDAPLQKIELEPWVGGRIVEHGTDGSECSWSRILVFDPPRRLVFTWDITLQWTVEPDPARCSEIEVNFTALDADTTQVELEHRHLDRHGEGWGSMASAVSAAHGWAHDLTLFAAAAAQR